MPAAARGGAGFAMREERSGCVCGDAVQLAKSVKAIAAPIQVERQDRSCMNVSSKAPPRSRPNPNADFWRETRLQALSGIKRRGVARGDRGNRERFADYFQVPLT
jgi:hypothetical protein